MKMDQTDEVRYISKEQFCKQAHIGKATALCLIRSGAVPAIDTGKQTNRYLILQSDVDEYIRKYDKDLREHQIKQGGLIRDIPHKYQVKAAKAFQRSVKVQWANHQDLLWLPDVEQLLGYSVRTLRLWCKEKGLKHFVIQGKICIPKKSLVSFVGSKEFHELPLKSEQHLNLLREIAYE